jgi:hypothetical protein
MVCLYFISFFLKFIFCCSLSSTAHASCLFKNKMYVIGGHGDTYPTYNLIESDKTADVWYSENMSQFPLLPPSPTRPSHLTSSEDWTQITDLRGDFYAQNHDALQPGPVAPWYARYGHSLDAITVDLVIDNRPQEVELMVLMGGFAPLAINDVWVTEDGTTWL